MMDPTIIFVATTRIIKRAMNTNWEYNPRYYNIWLIVACFFNLFSRHRDEHIYFVEYVLIDTKYYVQSLLFIINAK